MTGVVRPESAALLQPDRNPATCEGDSGTCILTTLSGGKVPDRFISPKHRRIKYIAEDVRAPIEIQVLRVLTARMWIYGK